MYVSSFFLLQLLSILLNSQLPSDASVVCLASSVKANLYTENHLLGVIYTQCLFDFLPNAMVSM